MNTGITVIVLVGAVGRLVKKLIFPVLIEHFYPSMHSKLTEQLYQFIFIKIEKDLNNILK